MNAHVTSTNQTTMTFKLITSTALLVAASLSPVQAQTIEWQPIFRYAFEQSDLTRFDRPDWGDYNISIDIESTYTGSDPWAALLVQIYDDKGFTGRGYNFDLFATGGMANLNIPQEFFGQTPLGWADGIGSLEILGTGGPITLNKLSFRITAPSVGYFKDVSLSAVPEPSVLVSLLGGLMATSLVLRRRKKK